MADGGGTGELLNNGNGRVTLALLGQKLDATNALLKEFIQQQRECNARTEARLLADELSAQARETRLGIVEDQVEKHEDEIDGLKSSDKKWGAAGGIIGALAGILTGIFRPGG